MTRCLVCDHGRHVCCSAIWARFRTRRATATQLSRRVLEAARSRLRTPIACLRRSAVIKQGRCLPQRMLNDAGLCTNRSCEIGCFWVSRPIWTFSIHWPSTAVHCRTQTSLNRALHPMGSSRGLASKTHVGVLRRYRTHTRTLSHTSVAWSRHAVHPEGARAEAPSES